MEYIIEIMSKDSSGYTSKEVHQIFTKKHKSVRDIATIRQRIKDLSKGTVESVICQYSTHRNGIHTLQDKRLASKKSVLSKAELFNAEKEYLEMAMKMLKELNNFSVHHYEIIEEKLDFEKEDSVYFTESQKFESIGRIDKDLYELKLAIDRDTCIDFEYSAKKSKPYYKIEPYRLILIDKLWYLFGKDLDETEDSALKAWRIKYIKQAALRSEKYTISNKEIDELLSKILSADFVIGEELYITVKIYPDIVEDFDFDIHLPGFQKNTKVIHEDGSISATALVTTYEDIEQDIKRWFPHIEILEPLKFRKDFFMTIEAYRDRFKDEIEKIKKSQEK